MYKVGMKSNYSCLFSSMIIFFSFQVNACAFNFGFQDISYETLQQCELAWINPNWLIPVFSECERRLFQVIYYMYYWNMSKSFKNFLFLTSAILNKCHHGNMHHTGVCACVSTCVYLFVCVYSTFLLWLSTEIVFMVLQKML